MTDEPQALESPAPEVKSSLEGISPAAYVLAVFWVVLPALQYMGAVERTVAVTERGASIGPLGTADFSVWYICLAVLTAAYVTGRTLKRAGSSEERNGGSQ